MFTSRFTLGADSTDRAPLIAQPSHEGDTAVDLAVKTAVDHDVDALQSAARLADVFSSPIGASMFAARGATDMGHFDAAMLTHIMPANGPLFRAPVATPPSSAAGGEAGIDFLAAGSISANTIAAHGYDFVANYLGRGLTADLADDYQGAGLSIVSIYETTVDYYYSGAYHPSSTISYNPNTDRTGYLNNVITYWDGYYQAQRADGYADGVGQKAGSAIYFAVDTDILSSDVSKVLDYFSGIQDGLDAVHSDYKIGIYGDHNALDAAFGADLADYKWLAYGWRYDGVTSYDISQTDNDDTSEFGTKVDHDITSSSDYGQWGQAASVIRGDGGDNTLHGTSGPDRIVGLGGDDFLSGLDGNDRIIGGGDDDLLIGGLGRDYMKGGPGSEVFGYTSVAQSDQHNYDNIVDFHAGGDEINLWFTVTHIDPAVHADSLGSVKSALAGHHLGAHHAALVDIGTKTFLAIDANGIAGYQVDDDMIIRMDGVDLVHKGIFT